MIVLFCLPIYIVPSTEAYGHITEGLQRISGTYLHGKLQSDAGYDIFDIQYNGLPTKGNSSIVDTTNLLRGKYPAQFEGKECTFFFWFDNNRNARGLCVYNDDTEAFNEAEQHYNLNQSIL